MEVGHNRDGYRFVLVLALGRTSVWLVRGAELPPQPANTDKAVTIARMVLAFSSSSSDLRFKFE